jgi:hypothetical protein
MADTFPSIIEYFFKSIVTVYRKKSVLQSLLIRCDVFRESGFPGAYPKVIADPPARDCLAIEVARRSTSESCQCPVIPQEMTAQRTWRDLDAITIVRFMAIIKVY